MVQSIAWWPTVVVLGVATFTDLRSRRIPNWLVLPFLGAGVLASCWFHGWHGLGQSLSGAGLGLLLFGVFFLVGGMGAGDVKLLRGDRGLDRPLSVADCTAADGLGWRSDGAGRAVWGGFLGELFQHTGDLVFGAKEESGEAVLTTPRRRKMPYAPAIAIGTLMSFLGH